MKSFISSVVFSLMFCAGAQSVNEDIWEYENDWEVDGAIMLTGFKEDYWPQGTIFVPGEIDGKRVVRLGYKLFDDYDDVKTIIVADSIKYIEEEAFDCEAERIVLPSSMDCSNLYLDWIYCNGSWTETSWVGSYFNMNYLKKIEFSNGKNVSDNGKVFIIDNMLLSVNHVDGIGITTNLLGICGRAYENKRIYVPDGVTGILCQTFEDCGCSEISFPSSLRALGGEFGGGYCFGWNENLKRVEVRGQGSPYKVIGGSLVDTRTKTLVLATAGTEIPNDDSVKSIGVWSFTGSMLNKIVIPSSVRTIARSAFMDAWRAQTIMVGSGATNIYGGAFTSLYSIKNFYIDEENPFYEVVNGCVVDKRNNRLISPCYGRMTGGVCEVPYFCTSFADSAFKDEYEIATVVLPRNMAHYRYSEFHNEGFASWSDVERVVIADCEDEWDLENSKTYESLVYDYEDWVEHLDYWKGFSYTSLPQVAVRCRGRVMAKGFGRYKPGTKVNLTATAADKGFGVRWLDEDGNVVGTKNTLAVVMPNDDVCYTVEPVLGDDAPGGAAPGDGDDQGGDTPGEGAQPGAGEGSNDDEENKDNINDEYAASDVIQPILLDELFDGAVSYKVKGLPAGLKFTAKAITVKATKTTPAYDVPANAIYGAPTKSGVYKAIVTAIFADKFKSEKTIDFIVRKNGEKVVIAECDVNSGKVTGSGVYAVGKKIVLKATANKGYVFAGWYEDEAFTTPCDSTVVDYRMASYSYTMGNTDKTFYARFIPVAEDTVLSFTVDGEDVPATFTVSEYAQLSLDVDSFSLPKISVKGLPAGMKFTAKPIYKKGSKTEIEVPANTIYGAPTKPGGAEIKVSLSNQSIKKALVKEFSIEVPNLTGANGYFVDNLDNGVGKKRVLSVGITNIGDFLPSLKLKSNTAKLTVKGLPAGLKYDTKTGKITGVATKPGTYTVTLTVTDGKAKYVSTIMVEVEALPDWAVGTFNGYIDGSESYAGDWVDWVTITINSSGKVSYKDITEDGSVFVVNPKGITFKQDSIGNYIIEISHGGSDWYDKKELRISYTVIDGVTVGVIEGDSKGADIEDGGAWIQPAIGEFYACQNVWKNAQGTKLAPTFIKNTITSVTMSRMRDDDWDPYYGGSLTLKFGSNGAVTTAYSEYEGGKAAATGAAQLVPYDVDIEGNVTKAWLYTALKPKVREPFGVLLFLSIDTSSGIVDSSDVLVDDYLLEVDD